MKTKPKPVHPRGYKLTQNQKRFIHEYDADRIGSNYWINIGLPENVAKRLTILGKRFSNSSSPCATGARLLISAAMLHRKDTESNIAAMVHYILAEGFHSLGSYCEGAIPAQ